MYSYTDSNYGFKHKKRFEIAFPTVSNLCFQYGTRGGTRTHTVSLPADFESAAATITPFGHIKIINMFMTN